MKKENGKKEESPSDLNDKKENTNEIIEEKKDSNGKILPEKKSETTEIEADTMTETGLSGITQESQKIMDDSKKIGSNKSSEKNSSETPVQQKSDYVIPQIQISQRKIMDLRSVESELYFSKKRKELIEKSGTDKRKIKKEKPVAKLINAGIPDKESNDKRFILRESKLIKKGIEAVLFNSKDKTGAGKEKVEKVKKEDKTEIQKPVIKRPGQRVDRDSTLFVISTIRRLIDEERITGADADADSIFSKYGLKLSKSKAPLTRSRLAELKKRKPGVRHPKEDIPIIKNQFDLENYNLNKMVETAKEIFKTYHEVLE